MRALLAFLIIILLLLIIIELGVSIFPFNLPLAFILGWYAEDIIDLILEL